MNSVFFAKFQKSSKLSTKRSFVVSTDRSAVEEEKRTRQISDANSVSEAKTGDPFFKINQEIFDTFVAYYDLAPVVIGIARALPAIIIEEDIKKRFKAHGTLLDETESHEIYSIEKEQYPKISQDIRRIEASSVVADGVDRFFVMGLISLYDQFIYNLARAESHQSASYPAAAK